AEDVVVRHLAVERGDQASESVLPDDVVDLEFVHGPILPPSRITFRPAVPRTGSHSGPRLTVPSPVSPRSGAHSSGPAHIPPVRRTSLRSGSHSSSPAYIPPVRLPTLRPPHIPS